MPFFTCGHNFDQPPAYDLASADTMCKGCKAAAADTPAQQEDAGERPVSEVGPEDRFLLGQSFGATFPAAAVGPPRAKAVDGVSFVSARPRDAPSEGMTARINRNAAASGIEYLEGDPY
jgi:hypothetical protein